MSPFCSVSSLQGTLSHLSGGTVPSPARLAGPPHVLGLPQTPCVTRGAQRDPRSDPGAHLGDSAWKLNLRRAAFIWGGKGEVTGRHPQSQPPQIPHGVGPSQPHLLLLPLDGLHGVPQVRQAGEGPWPEGVCKERVSPARVSGVPHGRAWGLRGAKGGLTSARAPVTGQPQPTPLHAAGDR